MSDDGEATSLFQSIANRNATRGAEVTEKGASGSRRHHVHRCRGGEARRRHLPSGTVPNSMRSSLCEKFIDRGPSRGAFLPEGESSSDSPSREKSAALEAQEWSAVEGLLMLGRRRCLTNKEAMAAAVSAVKGGAVCLISRKGSKPSTAKSKGISKIRELVCKPKEKSLRRIVAELKRRERRATARERFGESQASTVVSQIAAPARQDIEESSGKTKSINAIVALLKASV